MQNQQEESQLGLIHQRMLAFTNKALNREAIGTLSKQPRSRGQAQPGRRSSPPGALPPWCHPFSCSPPCTQPLRPSTQRPSPTQRRGLQAGQQTTSPCDSLPQRIQRHIGRTGNIHFKPPANNPTSMVGQCSRYVACER